MVDNNLFIQLNQEKFNIILDYQKFNNQCHEVNMLLAKHRYFLRVLESRNKFRHLALKNLNKQNIIRQLSSCINKKYNGFHVISIEYSKKLRKKFKPIDIIYKPVKLPEKKISVATPKVYQNRTEILAETQRKLSHGFAFECYYCRKYFVRAEKQKRHVENCSGVPRIIYNFSNKNLITFEDNFKSEGDMPMAMYFDFETTAPTDNFFNPKQKKMFFMSHVLIVAFHLHLNLRKIIVQRSYRHSLEQLIMIDYLTNDQMSFIDVTLVKQLKDIAQEVSRRKCKNAWGQMFTIETALTKKTLVEWFNNKIKSQHLELDLLEKKINMKESTQ